MRLQGIKGFKEILKELSEKKLTAAEIRQQQKQAADDQAEAAKGIEVGDYYLDGKWPFEIVEVDDTMIYYKRRGDTYGVSTTLAKGNIIKKSKIDKYREDNDL